MYQHLGKTIQPYSKLIYNTTVKLKLNKTLARTRIFVLIIHFQHKTDSTQWSTANGVPEKWLDFIFTRCFADSEVLQEESGVDWKFTTDLTFQGQFFEGHFPIAVRNFCPQASLQFFVLLDYGLFFLLSVFSNHQDNNRMSFILAKTFELNNKRTLGLLCEKAQYKLVSLQDGWLALKGAIKNLVPSFGASFRRRLLN